MDARKALPAVAADAAGIGTEAAYDAAIDYARKLGAEHGRNAAEWWLQDTFGGRVSPRVERMAAGPILRGIEDGDPAILDTFPAPDLSGEWADTLTGPQLLADAFADADPDHPADEAMFWHADAFTDLCDAYESAFSDAVTDAIETAARAVLA